MFDFIPRDVYAVLFPLIAIAGGIFLGLHYRGLLDIQQCHYLGRRLIVAGFAFAVFMLFGFFWRDGRFNIELLNPYRGQSGKSVLGFFGGEAFGVFIIIAFSLGFVLCGWLFLTKPYKSV